MISNFVKLILENVRPQGNILEDHLILAACYFDKIKKWNYGRFNECIKGHDHLPSGKLLSKLSDQDGEECWLIIIKFLSSNSEVDKKPRDTAKCILFVSACTYSTSSFLYLKVPLLSSRLHIVSNSNCTERTHVVLCK